MNAKQYTFSEMSRKMVINVADGHELGHVCDMVFNNCGGVLGFVVPGKKSFFKSITSSETIFIPWNRIIKIGSDVILTEMVGVSALSQSKQTPTPCDYPPAYAQQTCGQPKPEPQYAPEPRYSRQAAMNMGYTANDESDDVPATGAQTFYHTTGDESNPNKYKEL